MRHRVDHRKLGLPTDQRMALLKNQVKQLFLHERLMTTETKAKEVQRVAEKLITQAKRNTEASRREVNRVIQRPPVKRKRMQSAKYRSQEHPERQLFQKLLTDIGPRFAERHGGYTRLLKAPPRRGDGAPMALLMLVE
ncbi:MAG: 50S ribosomal protein L17 [Armatimonadetes bacterium CG_4_10_14_3_um_filter_66_18]|nr:50S ribosomal protein L17 [Armatimonadota bacterium]OIO95657.1 MAG: 50S ribosomal protein L17 [Armatimonadetes bacterium CG2_30_66_41]PIU94050.1 MAG: 50S ribosomal protein L17 [Armatimonadetes bacterium CG06_land_8_20_14_3_00_66_21]PIW19833.1 MAG: 50S ribosomal protein L17 [Armatimonadetes bacterium CG17_big_fil_post_rev_8_21_14_2_50_66_6]PIX43094.1 MAG: 50S ribosomal protein L17 [Armatimonadetes bacterium CG_4_8_14_3_um_filter_66_20]PIY36186.1 MAG: 50S ribosomal protein L17 [Armatimonadete